MRVLYDLVYGYELRECEYGISVWHWHVHVGSDNAGMRARGNSH